MSISFSSSGSFRNTERFLSRMRSGEIFRTLDRFGAQGTAALAAATPVESGITAASWYHEIKRDGSSYSIIWGNSHDAAGTPVAILLQMGHGTGTGGYVQGRDYINPALRPIFDQIAAEAWKAVTS